MADLIDLYTPRIEEEGRRQRFKIQNLTETLNEAAKTLFQYSYNKDLIDKAYAEIAAKADAQKRQNLFEDALRADELKGRRYNAALVGAAHNPHDPAAAQQLEDAITEYTGVRPNFPTDPQSGGKMVPPDLVNTMWQHMIDPKTGEYNPETLRMMVDASKMESPTGKLLSDWTKLREQGVPDEDPKIQFLMEQLYKEASVDINSQAGNYLRHVNETQGPEAMRAVYEYWKTLGSKGMNLTVKLPDATERKEVIDALTLGRRLNDIREMNNQIKAKYGAGITGFGSENLQTIYTRLGQGDPLIDRFQRAVNDYKNERVRIISGAQTSAQEIYRNIGDRFGTGGAIITNQMTPATFDAVLDENTKWNQDYLDAIMAVQGAYGMKVPDITPYTENPPPAGPQGAAPENESGVGQRNKPGFDAERQYQQDKRRRDELMKKQKQSGGKPVSMGPPPTMNNPNALAMMFNRMLSGAPNYGTYGTGTGGVG